MLSTTQTAPGALGVMMKRWTIACVLFLRALTVYADDAPEHGDVSDRELRRQLLQRMKVDQDARTALINWMNKHGANGFLETESQNAQERAEFERLSTAVQTADRENTQWLKNIVDEHGWPTRTMVGEAGTKAAWLLVQHADADSRFQRNCLDLMAKLPKEEVSQVDLGYLTDRVRLSEGKKQIYGTQFHTVGGKLQPRPLEDEANVDKRRADIGLPPLAEYVKDLEKLYGSDSK